MKGETALPILDDLYEEYHVFQFDSAMAYADKGLSLARQKHNDYFTTLFTIHRSEILAIGGLYSEALECLNALSEQPTDSLLRFKQLIAYNVPSIRIGRTIAMTNTLLRSTGRKLTII